VVFSLSFARHSRLEPARARAANDDSRAPHASSRRRDRARCARRARDLVQHSRRHDRVVLRVLSAHSSIEGHRSSLGARTRRSRDTDRLLERALVDRGTSVVSWSAHSSIEGHRSSLGVRTRRSRDTDRLLECALVDRGTSIVSWSAHSSIEGHRSSLGVRTRRSRDTDRLLECALVDRGTSVVSWSAHSSIEGHRSSLGVRTRRSRDTAGARRKNARSSRGNAFAVTDSRCANRTRGDGARARAIENEGRRANARARARA